MHCVRGCGITLKIRKKKRLILVVEVYWVCFDTKTIQHFQIFISGLKWVIREPAALGLNKFQRLLVHASDSSLNGGLEVHPNKSSNVPVSTFNGVEPFHGKSGSVSFCGLTHQSVEEGKLESAPFEEKGGSYLWVLAPTAFIASLILPQFFVDNVVEAFLNDTILIGIGRTLCFLSLSLNFDLLRLDFWNWMPLCCIAMVSCCIMSKHKNLINFVKTNVNLFFQKVNNLSSNAVLWFCSNIIANVSSITLLMYWENELYWYIMDNVNLIDYPTDPKPNMWGRTMSMWEEILREKHKRCVRFLRRSITGENKYQWDLNPTT